MIIHHKIKLNPSMIDFAILIKSLISINPNHSKDEHSGMKSWSMVYFSYIGK